MKILAALLLMTTVAFAKESVPCISYLFLMEHDAQTMNLNMSGPNGPQKSWYRKGGQGKDFSGVCLIDADKTGRRVALADGVEDPDHYMESVVGDLPLYILGWEEHMELVPDNNGGHNAYYANGILYKMNLNGDGKLVTIGPVHDTNKTIFSSSSVSLLKAAIKQIKGE